MYEPKIKNLKRNLRNKELLMNGLMLLTLMLLVILFLYIVSPAIERIFFD